MSDLIRRQDAIDGFYNVKVHAEDCTEYDIGYNDGIDYAISKLSVMPSAEAVQGWIPIKYHEITESERKENGYPKDWVYFLDCEMPQDEQEILVQAKNGVIRWDVCYEDDGFSLDSGWDWKDDILAWMPLPEPYKGGDEKMTRDEAIQRRDIIVTQFINELGVTIETNTKPLIHCKDCKHQEECEQIVVFDIHVASVQGHRVDSCSYGERREP